MLKDEVNNDKYRDRSHPAHFPLIHKHNRPNIVFLTICSKDRKNIFA
jgi:hypothetical protein